ncbi:MAG: 50S ribosomal protein L4 [Candidatus Woesebacteria bacterium]|nr:MAG: 50S ribosomal protein L4 [Candidatus Woesebacteria bacterium]
MAKIDLYTIKGVKSGDMVLPKSFDEEINMNTLAQALRIYEENAHPGLRNTKTRSEVNRTTKKVYKQKGTGGARHGSRRANLFVGGGIIFGPRPERRILNISDKLKIKAKLMAFAYKLDKKEIVAVTGISKITKTKEPAGLLNKLGAEIKAKRFTFVLSEGAVAVNKFLRNLKDANFVLYKDVNALDIYYGGTIIMDDGIFGNEQKEVKSQNSKVKNANKKEKVTKVKKTEKK